VSRATATVTFRDGMVLYGLYNGTVDHMIHDLFASRDERDEFWGRYGRRLPGGDYFLGTHQLCGCDGEPCEVEHTYGAGRTWDGRACREHLLFIGPTDPDADLYASDLWTWREIP